MDAPKKKGQKHSKGGKKGRKIGRNKVKCAQYRAARRRFKNKLRRVERCNGRAAAREYVLKYADR